jgi:hypothetical protein
VFRGVSAAFTPAQRYALRRTGGRLRQTLRAAAPWCWHGALLAVERDGLSAEIDWMGRPDNLGPVAAYLGATQRDSRPAGPDGRVRAFDHWRPGTFRVPVYLDAMIDLGQSYDLTVAGCNENIRRVIRRHAARVELAEVSDPGEVASIDDALIRPFAQARHGPAAAHIRLEQVQAFARGHAGGCLTVLSAQGEPLACHLGFESWPHGVKTWNALRFGYAPRVFDEPKALDELNTVNLYRAAVWARERGFRQYNLGASPGQPDSGLLQWKGRRGAGIDADRTDRFFHLDVPLRHRPSFFWVCPIYGLRRGELCLTLGLPGGMAAPTVLERLRKMVFKGVRSIDIYCDGAPEAAVESAIERLGVGESKDLTIRWNLVGRA